MTNLNTLNQSIIYKLHKIKYNKYKNIIKIINYIKNIFYKTKNFIVNISKINVIHILYNFNLYLLFYFIILN